MNRMCQSLHEIDFQLTKKHMKLKNSNNRFIDVKDIFEQILFNTNEFNRYDIMYVIPCDRHQSGYGLLNNSINFSMTMSDVKLKHLTEINSRIEYYDCVDDVASSIPYGSSYYRSQYQIDNLKKHDILFGTNFIN